MRKIKKALPIALVIMALFSFLALGVSAADCEHLNFTYEDSPLDCTTNLRVYTCTICGYSYDDQVIGFNNHEYEENEVEAPTCTTSGTMEYTCKNCGDSYTSEIPATGHDFEEEYHAPTCTKDGWINGLCACGERSYEKPDFYIHIPATGIHVFQDGICIECGNSSSDLCNHDLEYKANSSETHMLYCSKCDSYQGEEQGHSWSNREQLEMVSEFIAKVRYTCSVCNTTTIVTESLTCNEDHNWSYHIVDENYHRQECITCLTIGETLPHRWDNGVIDQAPSLNVEGYYRYTCLDCNAIKETITPALTIDEIVNRCTNKEAVQLFDALYNKFKPAINAESSTVTILEMSGLSEFVNKIFPDIEENHYASQYWAEYSDVYQILYDGLIDNDLAYELGYNDAISAVVDKNPIQGLFQGMFAGMAMFYQTVTAGISLGGISLNNAVTTIVLIVLAFLLLKVLLKRG